MERVVWVSDQDHMYTLIISLVLRLSPSFPSLAVRFPLNRTVSDGKLGAGLGTRIH